MSGFFNYENKVMSTINKVADSVVLGMLWLLCSIPVFTTGASSAAFYYAFNKCICQKSGYAWKTFFSSFKENFKQATQIWLLVLALTLLSVIDCYILSYTAKAMSWVSIVQAAIIGVLLLSVMWGLYLFPYLSRFENPNKVVIKNCALIMLANLPWSFLLLVLFVAAVIVFLFVPILSLFAPSLYMLAANKILERIFRKYMLPEQLAQQMQLEQDEASG